jgi:methyltransferase (TIGR00027 family)
MSRHRPSYTAIKVSKGTLFLAQDPVAKDLLPKGAAEWTERLLVAAGIVRPWELSLMRQEWFRKLAAFAERHTMPGQSLYMALRKRFFDDEVRDAIANGAPQVLVVGAGFDTLCARLAPEHPDVIFVEIDQPGTHAVKKAHVETIGAARRNLHFSGVDLATTSLDEVLSRLEYWDEAKPAVVVAEGVLMYLGEDPVSRFLEAIEHNTISGSRLLFTYLRADKKGKIQAGKLSFMTKIPLMMIGEPWRWGVKEGELEEFMQRHGFELDHSPDRCDLRRRYLESTGLGDLPKFGIEFVAIAHRLPN